MASKKLPRTECKGGGRILWSTGSPVFIAGSTLVLLAPSSASSGAQASTLPWRVNLNRPCEGSWRKVDKMATKQIGPCEAIRDGKTCGEPAVYGRRAGAAKYCNACYYRLYRLARIGHYHGPLADRVAIIEREVHSMQKVLARLERLLPRMERAF